MLLTALNSRSIAAWCATAVATVAYTAGALPVAADPLPPAPVAAEHFDVGTLHVDRYGKPGAPPLVLVPGLASGPWTWFGTIAHEAATHDIYALTLPGFDGRPAVKEPSLFGAFERDLTALITTRKLAAPVLIGHSLGGTLAFAYAEREPQRLSAIVAVDGLPVFPLLATATDDSRATTAATMAASIAKLDRASLLPYDRRFMQTIGTRDPALVEPVAVLQAKSDPGAMAAWLAEDLAIDLRPQLNRITVPVAEFMPYDANEPVMPGAPSYTFAQTQGFYTMLLAGANTAQVIPIENARHYAMLDQPALFYTKLDAFMASVGAKNG